jgi:DNA-binding FadR family transcriptional regulator
MSINAIPRDDLHRVIQERVKQFIVEQGYTSGDLLPPEAELARQLGTSRASLREAIRSLQTLGIVETRHGRGTFVGTFSFGSLTDGMTFQMGKRQANDGVPRELIEMLAVREVLESSLVARLVHDYTDDDIANLYALAAEMEQLAANDVLFTTIDWRFHELLYRPAHNQWLTQLLESFWTVFYRVRDSPPEARHLVATARHHREVVDAIVARDPDAAARAMAVHFTGVMEWVSEQGGVPRLVGDPLGTGRTP